VIPENLNRDQALALMVRDPILIRRPLLETAAGCCCGFDPGPVLDFLGVKLDQGEDLQSCSKPGPDSRCDQPRMP
jgi:hypothetical protein